MSEGKSLVLSFIHSSGRRAELKVNFPFIQEHEAVTNLAVTSSFHHGHDDVLCGHKRQLLANAPLNYLEESVRTTKDTLM